MDTSQTFGELFLSLFFVFFKHLVVAHLRQAILHWDPHSSRPVLITKPFQCFPVYMIRSFLSFASLNLETLKEFHIYMPPGFLTNLEKSRS